jgi:hypothetical protein
MPNPRYELRKTATGFTVWDTATGTPAISGWLLANQFRDTDSGRFV